MHRRANVGSEFAFIGTHFVHCVVTVNFVNVASEEHYEFADEKKKSW